MFKKDRVIKASVLCLATVVAARGQADPCQQGTVVASVFDEQGKPVRRLAADNFSAQIKGKQVRIRSAQFDEHRHRVVVVLDSSGKMFASESQWDLARSLALDAMAVSPVHFRAGLIVFNDQIRVKLPVQEDTQAARDALNALTPPHGASDKTTGGHTALLDALMAATQLLAPPQFGDSIYVIADGGDNKSKATPKKLRAALASRGIRLFAELFRGSTNQGPPPEENANPQDLIDLAKDSGGLALSVASSLFPGGYWPPSFKLNPMQEKHLHIAILYLYSIIEIAYRLEIALPAPTKKSEQWKLTVLPPKDLKGRWLVYYPKWLDTCAGTSSAAR